LNERRRSKDKKSSEKLSAEKPNAARARTLAEAVVGQDGSHLITLPGTADTRGEMHHRSQNLNLLHARSMPSRPLPLCRRSSQSRRGDHPHIIRVIVIALRRRRDRAVPERRRDETGRIALNVEGRSLRKNDVDIMTSVEEMNVRLNMSVVLVDQGRNRTQSLVPVLDRDLD